MGDFFQSGSVATLPRLAYSGLRVLEERLLEFTKNKPAALILPCHRQDLKSDSFRKILSTISTCYFLQKVVVGLDAATRDDYLYAREVLRCLPQKAFLLWNDGLKVQQFLQELKNAGLFTGIPGKGRNFWLCCGYVLTDPTTRILISHDCDILTYDRELLVRVLYPVTHPHFGFDFCKGYSARFSERLHGRLMRLMFTPLIRAMECVVGYHDFIRYLDSFRYPLAGEVAINTDFASRTEVAPDWGVEVALLAEARRLLTQDAICQVEFSERYDHKHQQLLPEDCSRGLAKSAFDVAKCIFYRAASEGIRFDQSVFDAILTSYQRRSQETIRSFEACADINCLCFDRYEEEVATTAFTRSIRLAAKAYLEEPWNSPWLPSWNRVFSAFPSALTALIDAAEIVNA